MQELEPTWGRALRVWWLIVWRSMLGAIVFGAIVGGIFGFVVGILQLPAQIITTFAPLLGGSIGLVWAVMVTRMALRKRYSDFRIALVPRTD
jgi:uncharacterized membrane protein